LADASFAEAGRDTRSDRDIAAMALLARIAGAVRVSWTSGFARLAAPPEPELRALAGLPLPDQISIKRAEGFALFSLYPESYLEAAVAASLRSARPVRVIGIRTIGTPLAALVAAALDAPLPTTVRPIGERPHFRVALAAEVATELLGDGSASFALVDEGPGLTGSSFGAVADFLEDQGVAPGRIHFFASHRGPLAPCARPRHRHRWAQARPHAVELGDLLIRAPRRPEHRLDRWFADIVGPAEEPLQELSGGRWRALRYRREADWPASNPYLERRKFLLRTAEGTWLLKFAGLGPEGARKLERARALHTAGFTPEVRGYRHGFLIERWQGELPSLDRGLRERGRLAAQLGRYLSFRARHFPAGPERGAPLARLLEMARSNASWALGGKVARRLDRFAPMLERLARRIRRIETDNRLHAWEWLLAPDGRLLKTDALDHHAAHDLVGCQDVAWDVAGATVELSLSPCERDRLCAAIAAEGGRPVDPDLLALLTPCYLALQMGDCTLSTEIAADHPSDAHRLRAAAARYRDRLREQLLDGC
ncbi:MAG TPA: hypothetical protein VK001_08370, partial [Geminicoccaceae bacterium]|nr:hypothetical protein [Geminicoccaceae bacterium]